MKNEKIYNVITEKKYIYIYIYINIYICIAYKLCKTTNL